MNQELVQSFIAQINSTHGESLACDPEIEKWELLKCNKVREVGILLLDLKAQVGHGNFQRLFDKTENRFRFGDRMARNYMQFARLHPGEFKTWDQAHQAMRHSAVTLAEEAGHGAQTKSMLSWLDRVGTLTLRCMGYITGSLEKRQLSIDSMPHEERQRLKTSLQPARDLYEQL